MIQIYTDGSCSPNPGPGGWAYVIVDGDKMVAESSGNFIKSTNNAMELHAVAEALRQVHDGKVELVTDSRDVIGWCYGWNTVTNVPDPSKRFNVDKKRPHIRLLVGKIAKIIAENNLDVQWTNVRGHTGDKWNEYCDQMALDMRVRASQVEPEYKKVENGNLLAVQENPKDG